MKDMNHPAVQLLVEFLAKNDELEKTADLIRDGKMTTEEIYRFTDEVKTWNASFIARAQKVASRAVSPMPSECDATANAIIDFAYRVRYGELLPDEAVEIRTATPDIIRAVIIVHTDTIKP
jgi:hypothetical protein